MVGSNLERLLLPHQQPDLLVLLVLQELDLANAPLLPLVVLCVEAVELALTAYKQFIAPSELGCKTKALRGSAVRSDAGRCETSRRS